jgi:hypothetical protein
VNDHCVPADFIANGVIARCTTRSAIVVPNDAAIHVGAARVDAGPDAGIFNFLFGLGKAGVGARQSIHAAIGGAELDAVVAEQQR